MFGACRTFREQNQRWYRSTTARIEDLGPDDFVKVECIACGHSEMFLTVGLLAGLRLPPATLFLDLELRLRCRECDAKGTAVVTIRWAG